MSQSAEETTNSSTSAAPQTTTSTGANTTTSNTDTTTAPVSQKDETRKEVEGAGDDQPAPKRKRKSRWDFTPETSASPSASTNAAQTQPAMTVDTTIAQQLIAQQVLKLQQKVTVPSLLSTPVPAPPGPDCRIYVGSLNYDLKEADIKALFESFGTIRNFTMSYDNLTGKSKGYCFVEYETAEMAEAALAMNQFQLAGRPIKVGRPLNGAPGASAPPPNPMAAMLNIPLPSFTPPTVAASPANSTAQAFLNGLGASAANPLK